MSGRVLIFGAQGQVGCEAMRAVWPEGLIPIGLDRTKGDLTDPAAIAAAMTRYRPVALVNAAAYTAVDRAEQEPDIAFAANRDGPRNLAHAAAQRGVPLLHLSTDYVFDGRKSGAYVETDPVAPLGVYGRSKEAGEQAIRAVAPEHIILRTAWIFGALGHNFVSTMGRLALTQPKLSVVADQYGCPTPAAALAEGIVKIITALLRGNGAYGTFHFAGNPPTSWHGFAKAILSEGRHYGWPAPRLEAIATADFPTQAQRPANSVLECAKLASVFGVPPADWLLGLRSMLAECHTGIKPAIFSRIEKSR